MIRKILFAFTSLASLLIFVGTLRAQLLPSSGGTVRVSNPNLDFVDSVIGGFSQNTSSSARCGNSVVVGYVDTGARLRSGNTSINGVSVSTDGGASFNDLGFLSSGSNFATLIGNPVVACANSSRFYYASVLTSGSGEQPLSAIGVSKSSNGGRSWSTPVLAASTTTAFLDKPWIAVDPNNTARLFVTYTTFDVSGVVCGPERFAIELVRSTDGGSTWSSPVIIDNQCGDSLSVNLVTGSNVIVSPSGQVFVADELVHQVSGNTPNNEIHFAHSEDGGRTFSAPITVSDIVRNGVFGGEHIGLFGPSEDLKGGFATNSFPQLAVDRTSGSSGGTVYITWTDGRERSNRGYNYADVLVAKSTDGGQSFTVPSPVSPTPANFGGPGRDQFFPGIAVDNTGKVAVCYYDRRNDPANLALDRYCSVSSNQGASWQDIRISQSNWLPLIFSDSSVPDGSEMGQYDTVTTDFLLQTPGFFGAFTAQEHGNANIVGKQF